MRLRSSDTWAEAHKHPWMALACHNLWYATAEREGEGLLDDDDTLARLAGVKPAVWKTLKPKVLKAWELVDGRWVHPVIQHEARRHQMVVDGGKHGAAKRWKNKGLDSPPKGPPNGPPNREAKGDPNRVPDAPPNGSSLVLSRSSSSKEVSSASAPESPLDRLMKLLKLDHRALQRKPQFQAFSAFLHDWKVAGCDPERDVWPTIERVAARGQDIGSPRFFEKAIFKTRDDRIAAQPSEAERWATRVEAFRVSGFWPDAPVPEGFGPKPGRPGCLCPPELLIEAAA